MKVLRVNKRFAHALTMLRSRYMFEYEARGDILNKLIIDADANMISEITILHDHTADIDGQTNIRISDQLYNALQHIQKRHKAKCRKVISLGTIAETMCAETFKAAYYRELMNNNNNIGD